MMKSATNSVRRGKYIFQPTKYDDNGNIYCSLYRLDSNNKRVCKVTGFYDLNNEKFELIYIAEGWMNHNHKRILNFLLSQYDWV